MTVIGFVLGLLQELFLHCHWNCSWTAIESDLVLSLELFLDYCWNCSWTFF